MPKYWIFTYKVTVGERSFMCKRVVELRPTVDIKDYVDREFLAGYFGLVTMVEDNVFWSQDGGAAVMFSSAQEITKEEFDVLKRFL